MIPYKHPVKIASFIAGQVAAITILGSALGGLAGGIVILIVRALQ